MHFPETRWTRVMRARGVQPEARAALSDLCAAYYAPVRRFLEQDGHGAEAEELAQEFFARLLGGSGVDTAQQQAGRFRSWLLGAVKHFLHARRQSAAREKRGGGVVPASLAPGSGSAPGMEVADNSMLPPDAEFDRQWALTVLSRTLDALQAELTAAERAEHFAVLKPWLLGDADHGSQEEAAASLGLSGGAFRVAVHRLRQRYRTLLRDELAQTLGPRDSAEEELSVLRAALRG